MPGQTFHRKTLKYVSFPFTFSDERAITDEFSSALKLHLHAMLLSTTHNAASTVLDNLHHAFSEVALKSYYYIRSLPPAKRPPSVLIIRQSALQIGPASFMPTDSHPLIPPGAVDDSIKLCCTMLQRRRPARKDGVPYECSVSGPQARW